MAQDLMNKINRKKEQEVSSEVLEFYEYYRDEIENEISEDWDLDYLTKMIYNDVFNWNNADQSTGMSVRTESEISSLLEEVFEYLKHQPERCPDCARKYDSERFIMEVQSLPYGNSGCVESISVGYECKCGYEERF